MEPSFIKVNKQLINPTEPRTANVKSRLESGLNGTKINHKINGTGIILPIKKMQQ